MTVPATGATAAGVRSLSAGTAWRNVALVTLLLWVVLGVGCFGFGAQLVADRFGTSLNGTLVLDLVFLAGVLIVIAAVVGWQRAHGETIRDLGWRRPTRVIAIVVALVFGCLWTASSYGRAGGGMTAFLSFPWQRPVMAVIGIVLAFGEELAVRGFLMEQLRRGRVPAAVQVLVAGAVMGVYHGIIGGHYSVFYAVVSAVIFAIVSLIYLLGRRSLTPGLISHAMTHVFGDPFLLQGILFGALAMGAGR